MYWILFAEVDMISMCCVGVECECEDDDDVMRVIHGVSLETSVPISNKGLLFIDDIRL